MTFDQLAAMYPGVDDSDLLDAALELCSEDSTANASYCEAYNDYYERSTTKENYLDGVAIIGKAKKTIKKHKNSIIYIVIAAIAVIGIIYYFKTQKS